MKIGHAVMNENGGAHGGAPGDQTGKEIRTQEWYNRTGGWKQYIEPKDLDMAERAAAVMERICADARFGYDQYDRLSGYKQIRANGFDGAGKSSFDCSSLCLACYILAGLNVNPGGSTKNIAKIFESTGKFKVYTDEEHCSAADMAVRGGMWCTPGKHICMALETGADFARVTSSVDLTDPFLIVRGANVRVRTAPKTGRTVRILHKGDIRVIVSVDEKTGWYEIADGWITNNERYVEVVNDNQGRNE